MVEVVDELWVKIPEFPGYEVSNLGNIFNMRTKQEMRISKTNHGHLKISLLHEDGERQDRSVAKLVAEAFVKKPHPECDRVILLDGRLDNVLASNLAWRPKHFAWKYTRQMKKDQPLFYHNLPIINEDTGVEYESIMDCGIAEGLLFDEVYRSTYTGLTVYPTHNTYQVIDRV